MPKVYEFSAFPERIGVVVGKDEEISEAVTRALVSWARSIITEYNKQAYLSKGTLRLVKGFPDDNTGWDDAMEFAEDLETYY